MTSHENADERLQPSAFPQPPAGGRPHTLLVDDDFIFRRNLLFTLERLGFGVSAADNAEAALDVVTQDEVIQLLITDVAMPGMSGVDLAGKIRDIHPEVKVLYISGYPRRTVSAMGVAANSIHFLQKPFFRADLDVRIKRILAGG